MEVEMIGSGSEEMKDEEIELFLKSAGLIKKLNGDGDFRSKECIEYLKEADIVVTNPPFSLFREYIAQLIKFDKKFLIIGNQNAKFRIHNANYLVKCVDILIYLKDFFAIAIAIFRNISTFAFH